MTSVDRPLRVFLCHSSNDKLVVRELYQKLRAEAWLEPWLDEEELYPGQNWNLEIEKAVEAADAILVCLSNNSITKEGYVQKEIKTALDYSDYKPEGTIFIIPLRLEDCKPPSRLSKWQYADYFEGQHERGLRRLLVSLKRRANELELRFEEKVEKKESQKSPSSDNRFLKCGDLTLDLHTRYVTMNDRMINLPPTSFDYLLVLARHTPNVVDYKTLVTEAQGYETNTRDEQGLSKWHIHHIRQALEPDVRNPIYVINVRGTGYRLVIS
ncbi:MAG: TIR domain-containing protein [Chloroflexota bacterium]